MNEADSIPPNGGMLALKIFAGNISRQQHRERLDQSFRMNATPLRVLQQLI
ncbi:hypothetical protein D3C84_1282170 [compost metagenome]